jgi:hypothetical protein
MAAKIASKVLDEGTVVASDKPKSLWDATSIAADMQ